MTCPLEKIEQLISITVSKVVEEVQEFLDEENELRRTYEELNHPWDRPPLQYYQVFGKVRRFVTRNRRFHGLSKEQRTDIIQRAMDQLGTRFTWENEDNGD